MKHIVPNLVAILILAAALPASAQPYCYETILDLETPVDNPLGIDRIEYDWAVDALEGSPPSADVDALVLRLWAGTTLRYTDTIRIDGITQPFGGAARGSADVFWGFNLDFPRLEQLFNATQAVVDASSGEQFWVHDNADIPTDNEVWVRGYLNGAAQNIGFEQIAQQTTLPDRDCDGVGDASAPTTIELSSSPNPSDRDEEVTLTATVTTGPGEAVPGAVEFLTCESSCFDLSDYTSLGTFTLDGSGSASVPTAFAQGDTTGTVVLRAEYGGGGVHFTDSLTAADHYVRFPSTTTVTAPRPTATVGEAVRLSAAVSTSAPSGLATGMVTFKENGVVRRNEDLTGNRAETWWVPQQPGNRVLTVDYEGDEGVMASTSAPLVIDVRYQTTTTLSVSPMRSDPGQPVTLSAQVASGSGSLSGQVRFRGLDGIIGVATVNGAGLATLQTTFAEAGPNSIEAEYMGDPDDGASFSDRRSHYVRFPSTLRVIAPPSHASIGETLILQAKLNYAALQQFGDLTDGSMTVQLDGETLYTEDVGAFKFDVVWAPQSEGPHSLVVNYHGGDYVKAATSPPVEIIVLSGTQTQLTTSPNPSQPGQSVDLVATVTSGSGSPTGTVEFRDGGMLLGSAAISGGQATLSTTAIGSGLRTVSAHYQQTTLWRGSSVDRVHFVGDPGDTATTIETSAATIDHGQPVTFTATVVSAMGKSSGPLHVKGGSMITFRDSGKVLGQAPLGGSPLQAQLTTTAVGIGQRRIFADFPGAAGLNPSTSASLTQSVRAPTTTTIATSQNPAFRDDLKTTLIATVTSPNAGTPRGNVRFEVETEFFGLDTWTLGTAVLDATGRARLTRVLPGLADSVLIRAFYSGDANRVPSSVEFTLSIQDRPLAVTLVANPPAVATPSNSVDLTAAVTGADVNDISFYFYCDRDDAGTDADTDADWLELYTSSTTVTAPSACSYPAAGTYTAKVVVHARGESGETSPAEARVQIVADPGPEASFSFTPTSPQRGQPVAFTSTSTGPELSYAWDFNADGRTDSSQANPTWTFETGGDRRVTLTVSNAHARSSATETVAVSDERPHITGVSRRYDGHFMHSAFYDLENRLTIGVDWGGSPPGHVEVDYRSADTQMAVGEGAQFVFDLNMTDLGAAGTAIPVRLTPVSGGVRGPTHSEYFYQFVTPGWFGQTETRNDHIVRGEDVRYLMDFTYPHPETETPIDDTIEFPASMPVLGGPCRAGLHALDYDYAAGTVVELNTINFLSELSSLGKGRTDADGSVLVRCAGTTFGDRWRTAVAYGPDGLPSLSASSPIRLSPPRGLTLDDFSFVVRGEPEVTVGPPANTWRLIDAIPGFADLFTDPRFGEYAESMGTLESPGSLRLSFEHGLTLNSDGIETSPPYGLNGFKPSRGRLDVEASGQTPGGCGRGVCVQTWMAGGGSIEVGLPGRYIKEVNLALWFHAELTFDFGSSISIETSEIHRCNWVNGGPGGNVATCTRGPVAKAGDTIVFRQDHDAVRASDYATFAPRKLEPSRSVRVPKSVTNTEIVTNLDGNAAPRLVDLGQGTALLLWVQRDLSDPDNQAGEIAWSAFDGAAWGVPQFIADDTRVESTPVAGVDAAGRVVAAWRRIKDPAYSAAITGFADYAQFQSRFEVVTATYDPVAGNWGAVTALTDNLDNDWDLQMSRGPGGELLLTWLTQPGDAWISTAAEPATVRYASWDSGTAAWGAPADVASGLVGVVRHGAARGSGGAVVVLSRDPDFDVEHDDTVEYWQWNGTVWSGPTTLAAGGFGHTRPLVAYDSDGAAQVLWLAGREIGEGADTSVVRDLVQATLQGTTSTVVRHGSDSLAAADVQLISNSHGNLTLLWSRDAGDGPAQVHALLFDHDENMWSDDRQLIDDSQRQTNAIAATYGDDGVLRSAYLSTVIGRTTETVELDGETVTLTNIPVEGATDLRVLEHSLVRDLALASDGLTVSPPTPVAGDPAFATVVVHNSGDFTVGSFEVALYVGDSELGGLLVGTATVEGPFLAGEAREVAIAFDFPDAPGDLVALVDPESEIAELTRVNNLAVIDRSNLGPAALALSDTISGAFPLTIEFDGSGSSDPEGGPLTYHWVFGDGTSTQSGPSVVHTFVDPGAFTVTLIVTDDHGNVDTHTLTIHVGPLASGEIPDALRVDRPLGDDNLTLSWGDSCNASDNDYAVYSGALGDFTSHQPIVCSTSGLKETTFAPAHGDRYYLVVPRNGLSEGSYGADTAGAARAASLAACAPQNLFDCDAVNCTTLSQWASGAFASSEFTATDWAATQATGEPDTFVCGDVPTAWAPSTNLADPEWLEVQYATPVLASGVEIYETFATGGVYLIEARDVAGVLRTVWTDEDTTACSGILNANWPETNYLVTAIRIHTEIIDYEEIDAVQLHGQICD